MLIFNSILEKSKTCFLSMIFFQLFIVSGEVIVDFGNVKQPFVREEGNTTFLKNSDILVQIRCNAKYPTEWIHDLDDINSENSEGRGILEWTDRKFPDRSIDDGIYEYVAWIHLEHSTGLIESEVLICASIGDPTGDQVTVTLTPNSTDNTLAITSLRTRGQKIEDEQYEGNGTEESCDVQFDYQDRGSSGRYWRCQGPDGSPGLIVFTECAHSALQCQNAYRNIKALNSCTTVFKEQTVSLEGWKQIPQHLETSFSSGTVICYHQNSSNLRAQGYFYSTPEPGNTNGLRKLELLTNKMNSSDLIWMGPMEDEYFVNEHLKTKCHYTKFGFSFDPFGALTQNGTRIIMKKADENFSDYTWVTQIDHEFVETGHYVVQCLAPVWNTTEWVNKTKNINVKVSVPPTFKENAEIITFTEGDEKKNIACKVQGDPKPNITWENGNLPSVSIQDEELIFHQIEKRMAGAYICIASNRFGQTAMKTFHISVDAPVGTGVVIGIVGGCLISIILIIIFILLIRKFQKLSREIVTLTFKEVQQFRDGIPNQNLGIEESLNNVSIESMPYNSKYEVPRDKIFADENAILGAGAYGTVLKGTIASDSETKAVAFKIVPKDVSVRYFKALLSELKILAYIGEHHNIVGLVGACTANIKQRELFVGVELCKTSLVEFLRRNGTQFKHYFNDVNLGSGGSYENVTNQMFSTLNLIQWAEDIATGMDFLASKRVVHGDLAARNVLLSFDMQAKICDFGLARQLVDYNYTKSQVCPLPWKWMAIESLNQMKFSTHSDVWSYGVTIWEIFSLGNIPYPGITWSSHFVDQLIAGLRLSCPLYSNEVIYNMMIKSWNPTPKERPNFVEIIQVLKVQARAFT